MGWLFWTGYAAMGLWIGPRVAQWAYLHAMAEAPSSPTEARVIAVCLGVAATLLWPMVAVMKLMTFLVDTPSRGNRE